MQTYYDVLGVTPDAHVVVIKAAYRALAKVYHPDCWSGDKSFANEKMQKLNEAYNTLSNEQLRENYDKKFEFENSFSTTDFDDGSVGATTESMLETDWKYALDFYPNIEIFYYELSKMSLKLAQMYKFTILDTKEFREAERLKSDLESSFLAKYFGSSTELQQRGKYHLLKGEKHIALEINRAAVFFGSSAEVEPILNKIDSKYGCIKSTNEGEDFQSDNHFQLSLSQGVVAVVIIILIFIFLSPV